MCDCGCELQGCCDTTSMHRRFLTKHEEIENLKAYKAELEQEIHGVDERLKKLAE